MADTVGPGESAAERIFTQVLGTAWRGRVGVAGTGALPAVFPVTELATAAIGAAGVAVSDWLLATAQPYATPRVSVDRGRAGFWFASSLRPLGWRVPPAWDAVAGDYPAADGWIRLHTNVPAHRDAALRVLGVPADRARVRTAVARWDAAELESCVVAAGGCAAKMRSTAEWESSAAGLSVATEPLVRWTRTSGTRDPAPSLPGAVAALRPLHGVRVLDLTRVLAGPVATRFLAQLGAEVLRIDPVDWDEPGVTPDVMLGKRSARLDLRDPTHRARLLALLAEADILVHGYRPGALERLDLGSDVRETTRPGLIEVQLDAYGHSGPWAGRRGFDSLVQMSAGIAEAGMRVRGADAPLPLPVQALDHATGYLMAAAAIRGLTEQRRTGAGCRAALSLARTARLLTEQEPSPNHEHARDTTDADLDSGVEHTGWGPARRLRAPLEVDGVRFASALPARALGADRPFWGAAA
ncbi:CoA transferase, CAIB/BAIF family [Leucobacter sp. 7(1)]|uniref:CoA transferase n=1 Tax=Leucobacter sp. 7(1) TaxID=1255613 RepID=UPI00097EC5B8|nr:CoA transferase [Leucobacter sp. 7(1)]SJN08977.1 CoA transferase, CAIB/BAIF family [Leucobacter sp. 7(1)]